MDSPSCPCCGTAMQPREEDEYRIKLFCPSCHLTDVKLKTSAGQ